MASPSAARVTPPSPSAPAALPAPTVRIVRRHHVLVRVSHWLNVPLLLLLIASGISIYWGAPIFVHPRNAATHTSDLVGDVSVVVARVIPTSGAPKDWIYDHFASA